MTKYVGVLFIPSIWATIGLIFGTLGFIFTLFGDFNVE